MGYMFAECPGLTSLDLSSFDTSKVYGMDYMFQGCSGLTSIELSSFETPNVSNMESMFQGCSGIASLDLSSFNTPNLYFTNNMFQDCTSLTSLDISSLDMAKTQDWNRGGSNRDMFKNCPNLKYLDLSDKAELSDTSLTEVPNNDVYDGTWTLLGSSPAIKLTSAQLRSNFSSDKAPAGIWVWSRKDQVKVEFDPNATDASGSMKSYVSNTDIIYNLPDCGFYRSGYTFTAWNTQADGKGDSYQPGDNFNTEGKALSTLYAQWTPSKNTTKVTNGHFTVTIQAGQKITINGLPGGATYTVHEHNRSGWVLKSSENATGSIPALGVAQSKFTNAYNPDATSVDITATKTIDGAAPKDGAFSFTIASLTVGAPMPDGTDNATGAKSVTNTGTLVDFGHIVFTKPGTYIYTMKEVVGTDSTINYDTHSIRATVVISDPTGKGALVGRVTYTPDDAFSNTMKTGNLTIEKTVSGKYDYETQFSFSVTLMDAKSQPLTGKYGDLSVTNGQGSFKLMNGQSMKLTDLPAGTQYSVEETDVPDWYVSSSENASGTIVAAGSATAKFMNTYSSKPAYVYLTATKTLSGRTLRDGEFTFNLKKYYWDDEVLQTATNDEAGNVDFDGIELDHAGSYTYYITEAQSNDSDIQYSGAVYYCVVLVNDNGKGQLDSNVKYYCVKSSTGEDGGYEPVDSATFANAVKTGSISLTKKVKGTAAEGKTFDFQVKLTDSNGAPLDGDYSWTSSAKDGNDNEKTGTVRNGGTLSLAKDETITISGLPTGSKYEFAEADAAGYTQTDAENLSGTIVADQTAAATATNTYAASGSAQIKARKVVLRSGQETAPDDGAFTFTLSSKSDESETAPFDTLVATASNDGEGSVAFRKLGYTTEDAGKTFTYQIQEYDDGKDGYDYDSHTYLAKVTTTDKGNGTLECTVEYSTDDGKTWTQDVPVFKNDTVTRMPFAGADGFAGLVAAGGAVLVLSALSWIRRKRRMQ